MASNMTQSGYDCNWVEDPPEELKCWICLCVAREPRQHPGDDTNECGQVFCEACINKFTNRECPKCKGPLNTFKDASNSRRIKALKVKCSNLRNGCPWTGELKSLDKHLGGCDHAILTCPNKCQKNNEVQKFLRRNLQYHCQNECPRRMYKCPHCGEEGERIERVGTHLDTCPQLKVKCPNAKCSAVVPRCEVSVHRGSCNFERVPCKYEAVGCTEKPLRKDLKTHEDNDQLHLKVTIQQVLVLTKKIEMANLQMIKFTLPFKFDLNKFQQLKDDDKIFYSSHFYTSLDGYKMRIIVYPDGFGDGKGTHVSVFAYLMRGLNDDDLDWPFLGTVEFELLNQLEDKNHHLMTVTFIDNEYSQRVTASYGSDGGWGKHGFISHADLAYNGSKNCQYLKDDKLIFRINVRVPDKK